MFRNNEGNAELAAEEFLQTATDLQEQKETI